MEKAMREGSAPNFCPPVEEGIVYELQDEDGDIIALEFLGLIVRDDGSRFGFFFPVSEDEPAMSDGEVVILEVTEVDEEEQPASFELVIDEELGDAVFEEFRIAAKDLYDFE